MKTNKIIDVLLFLAYSLVIITLISGCAAEEATPKLEPEAVTVEPESEPKKDEEIKTEPNEGRAYLIKLRDHLNRFIISFEQFVKQLATPEATDEWFEETLDILEILQEQVEEARGYVPPEGYEDLHETYMKAMNISDEAFDYYTKGINEVDTDLLDKGNQKFGEASLYIKKASDMLVDDELMETLD